MILTPEVQKQMTRITERAREVFALLKNRDATLSTAESLTAGLVGSEIAGIPGASGVYAGGVIAYTDEAKVKLCGVPKETLAQYSAVSSQVAEAMALGVRVHAKATYGLSTTGYAGPSTGGESEPVGTFYVAVAFPDFTTFVRRFQHSGSRDENRLYAVEMAYSLFSEVLRS